MLSAFAELNGQRWESSVDIEELLQVVPYEQPLIRRYLLLEELLKAVDGVSRYLLI